MLAARLAFAADSVLLNNEICVVCPGLVSGVRLNDDVRVGVHTRVLVSREVRQALDPGVELRAEHGRLDGRAGRVERVLDHALNV